MDCRNRVSAFWPRAGPYTVGRNDETWLSTPDDPARSPGSGTLPLERLITPRSVHRVVPVLARSMSSNPTAPVEEAEEYHLTISDIGREGDGIALLDDFVIIVPDTKIGDSVTVRIEAVHDSFARGEVIERYE